MSRYFNSFMDDYSEDLEHSWGTSPKAKAREKEYNHWYYQKHKDELAAIRKQRHAATNYYKKARKSHDDALRNKYLANKMYDKYTDLEYSGHLKRSDADMLDKAHRRYIENSQKLESESREYKSQGARQKYSAKAEAKRILQHIKNPTVIDLVEFYLDTTIIPKAKKAAKKAKKYATKAISTAEKSAKKYATEAMPMAEKAANKAKKYATKAMSTAEKSARKAKKYATKTIKSVVR